jgi:Fe-S cluster biogenesis protein NfuA
MTQTLFRITLAALALVLLCTGNAQAATIQSSGALDGNSPTFNRRSDQTGNPASANTVLPYAVVGFTTGATGGTVTAAVGNTTQFDSFLTLYSSFDAANPQNSILAADDDGGTYPHATLSKAGLAANTAYVLVIASYSGQADAVFPVYGNYALSISGDVTDNWSITTTASPSAGGSVSCAPSSVVQGGNSTCTATPNAGYTFSTFSGDCSGATCVLSNVTAAKSVTASFTQNSYAITTTASPLAGGTVSCTANPVAHGSASTCTATANAGYTFGNFNGDCSGATCVLNNVTAAKSVSAVFTQNSYAITTTASPSAGGTVSCTANPVANGSASTCTATASAGYGFSSFSGDCSGATCLLSNVTAAKSVTATFIANAAPTASAVATSGTAQVGVQLSSSYTYADAENNPQGTSTLRWMVDTQTSGATKVAIAGATSSTYTATAAEQGKYLFFCVTPVASAGTLVGSEVCSSASAAVAAAAVTPPTPTPTTPGIPTLSLFLNGFTFTPNILNLGAGDGPAFTADMVSLLSTALGQQLQFVEQTPFGSVVLRGFNGGNLAFMPVSFQTSDARFNGIYPTGNGQYQVVRNGQSITIIPALVHVDQLMALFPGLVAVQADTGVITATLNGVRFVLVPGVNVTLQTATGSAQLVLGSDGFYHFMDAQGNDQVLYPALGEPSTLRNILLGLDAAATLSVQLDGTAKVVVSGKPYTLVPDQTLDSIPADRVGQTSWQEGALRYRFVAVLPQSVAGSSQGFVVKP